LLLANCDGLIFPPTKGNFHRRPPEFTVDRFLESAFFSCDTERKSVMVVVPTKKEDLPKYQLPSPKIHNETWVHVCPSLKKNATSKFQKN
jgi:hypothetical protein